MKKFTANYAFTNPNFVIQNLIDNPIKSSYLPLLYVLKNILQRGFPTALSKNLQNKLGVLHREKDFKEPFLFVSTEVPKWVNTIKGDVKNNYFPAKDFFEKEIPRHLGDFAFVQSLILPEVEINEIVGEYDTSFINQQVDFYLPQAKLVIEIDGQQHKTHDVTRKNDANRDAHLTSKGFQVVRITTSELRSGSFQPKIDAILQRLNLYERNLLLYKKAFQKSKENAITQEDIRSKLLPTAIMRFQILLIELLVNNYLNFDDKWNFNILAKEDIGNFAELAIDDLLIWFDNLCKLKKLPFEKPTFKIKITRQKDSFKVNTKAINVDFSLFERWTDQNRIVSDNLIIVRTDYFGAEKNYFKVSTAEPINYEITDSDKPALEFFLQNIFEKPSFRDGQFPIVANALNRKDTIGLLPTGGGKSLCYQLPCLLQPSVAFIVCPIKSLMYDQHQNLNNALITNTNFITSDLSSEEKEKNQREFAAGKYLFVWISSERFQISTFRNYLASVNANLSIAYAVVDEVHCLSEWGHDFRTSYLNLAKTIEKYCPTANFIGLTATASVNVLKDIKVEFARQRGNLEDENIKSLLDYSRKELVFDIIEDNGSKYKFLKDTFTGLVSSHGFLEDSENAGLVFTPHVNGNFGCYQLSNNLNQIHKDKVRWYSGEVPKTDGYDEKGNKTGKIPVLGNAEFKKYKKDAQTDFKKDVFPLLVATKGFGMGIDKQNIKYTFHYGLPSSVEALYQEAGRAGRWDKAIHPNKQAKCYVFYSKETTDPNNVEKLFHKDTTFAEIKAINEKVKWNGQDIFRQLSLSLQKQNDVADDFKIINRVIEKYFRQNATLKIWWNDAQTALGIKEDALQKAIYKLSLLGIVNDWTTDFNNYYEVEFLSIQEDSVLKALYNYISKYEPNLNIIQEFKKLKHTTTIEKCIWFLLQWTFENIAYNRKQSLKTLVDWCNEFPEIGNEKFKNRIDNYFRFTETTYIFQHIRENHLDYDKWFDVFTLTEKNEFQAVKKTIYIPTIENRDTKKREFERLRDSLSRILESTANSTGLNFVSGLIRLFLNDFEDSDGRIRFESALKNIRKDFSIDVQNNIIERLIAIGHHLEENEQYLLSLSIIKYYPNLLDKLIHTYGLYYLMNDLLNEKLQQLKSINQRLYEQLTEI